MENFKVKTIEKFIAFGKEIEGVVLETVDLKNGYSGKSLAIVRSIKDDSTCEYYILFCWEKDNQKRVFGQFNKYKKASDEFIKTIAQIR